MNLVFIAGALYIHHRYRQKKAWMVPGMVVAIVLPIVLMLFLRQFRLLSFSLLALAAVVFVAFRHCRREPVAIPTLAVIVASLFLPIDIGHPQPHAHRSVTRRLLCRMCRQTQTH
jgi:hypothetical protein